jgi:hypothetical protein
MSFVCNETLFGVMYLLRFLAFFLYFEKSRLARLAVFLSSSNKFECVLETKNPKNGEVSYARAITDVTVKPPQRTV